MTDPTRAVLRDALLERGTLAPEATEHDLLAEALEARRSTDPAVRELAEEVVETAESIDLVRTMWSSFRSRK